MLGAGSKIAGGVKSDVGGETGRSTRAGDGLDWTDRDSEDVFKGDGDRDWLSLDGGPPNMASEILGFCTG